MNNEVLHGNTCAYIAHALAKEEKRKVIPTQTPYNTQGQNIHIKIEPKGHSGAQP